MRESLRRNPGNQLISFRETPDNFRSVIAHKCENIQASDRTCQVSKCQATDWAVIQKQMRNLDALRQVGGLVNSAGLLIDRCVQGEQAIGTVFLIDENKAVTCAHLAILYADFLPALKVAFPTSKTEFSVTKAFFHPKFDREPAAEMARRALKTAVPALPLQDNNVVLLTLSSDLPQLEPSQRTTFNKRLSIEPLPRVKGIAGAIEELGLALVVQTVTNARKDGILYITDERNRPVARIFFRDGKIRHAKFGQLANEFAIYEMFQRPLVGQFFLKSQEQPDWEVSSQPLDRSTDMLLLEAHRRLDETAKLFDKLGGAQIGYVQVGELLNLDVISPESAKYAVKIYAVLDGGTAISELYDVVGLDTYTILSTLTDLLASRQIAPLEIAPPQAVLGSPLELAAYEPLSKWDEVISLTPHRDSGRAQMRRGNLVGMLRPNDPYHLLHTVRLPYQSAGCPIFKNDKLIGMHCGMLPLDPNLHALPSQLQQLIWVESIRLCMQAEATKKLSVKADRPSVGMIRPAAQTQGGKICSKCQSVMVREAIFCGTCGTSL